MLSHHKDTDTKIRVFLQEANSCETVARMKGALSNGHLLPTGNDADVTGGAHHSQSATGVCC